MPTQPITRSNVLWTFTQMYGATGGQPKVMTLGGWQAPFGRPRAGAMFNAGLKVRSSRTDYPGRNLAPTIHTFGTEKKPVEIHGRWMDRMIPQVGGALQMQRDWQDFISDQIPVKMAWGQFISYQVFIHDIDLQIEGAGDIVWAMKMHVLVDDQAIVVTGPPQTVTPFDAATQMLPLMQNLKGFTPTLYPSLLGMLNQLSDEISSIQDQINAPFAALFNVCSAISSFETAVSSDLTSILSGVTALQTGILTLRDATDNLFSGVVALNSPNALALNSINGGLLTGSDVMQFTTDKQNSDLAAAKMLLLLYTLELQVDRVRRGGAPRSAYVAQAGDTWESAATNLMGSADGGRKLRAMNAIKYGQQPMPGRTYSVPRS